MEGRQKWSVSLSFPPENGVLMYCGCCVRDGDSFAFCHGVCSNTEVSSTRRPSMWMCCMVCWTVRQVPLCAVSAPRCVHVSSFFFFARTHSVKRVRTSGIGRMSTRNTGTPLRYEGSHRAEPGGGHADPLFIPACYRNSEDGQTDSWQAVGDMPPTQNITCTDEHVLHHHLIPSVQFTLESNSVSTVDNPHDTALWK